MWGFIWKICYLIVYERQDRVIENGPRLAQDVNIGSQKIDFWNNLRSPGLIYELGYEYFTFWKKAIRRGRVNDIPLPQVIGRRERYPHRCSMFRYPGTTS